MCIKFGIFKQAMVMTMIPREVGEDHLADLLRIHSDFLQGSVDPLIFLLIGTGMVITVRSFCLAHPGIHHDLLLSSVNIPGCRRNVNFLSISAALSEGPPLIDLDEPGIDGNNPKVHGFYLIRFSCRTQLIQLLLKDLFDRLFGQRKDELRIESFTFPFFLSRSKAIEECLMEMCPKY